MLLIRASGSSPLSVVPEEIRGKVGSVWSWPAIDTFIKRL